MNAVIKSALTFCLATGLSFGANWNAKLVDESCINKNHSNTSSTSSTTATDKKSNEKLGETCAANASTTNFAIVASDGKIYKLDSTGNSRASEMWKSGTFKPDKDGDVHVTVNGTMQGETIKVDSLNTR